MERSPARRFEDLIVWQKSHLFVLEVYRLTKTFPREELYGLTSQFRRAAVSIPANVAEGFKKRGRLDKVRFNEHSTRVVGRMPLLSLASQRPWLCRN